MADENTPAAVPEPAAPLRAAGILFCTPDGRVLLMCRSDGAGWAFPGGGIEDAETPEAAARRELQEETGVAFEGELQSWCRRIRDGVDFTTFWAKVDEAFTPALNAEHVAYTWIPASAALTQLPLHPGVRVALIRPTLNERGVAEAMADGDLVSPQRYLNMLLVAIRITGTGVSYRSGLKEFVWRDPGLYLNQAFCDRCAGLPVIVEHTDKPMLDSQEYAERNVGSIMFAYIQGDEVWGIARVYDAFTSDLIENRQISTSPGVVFVGKGSAGQKFGMDDGNVMLIENEPHLLDHIALCKYGVWDHGGPAAGVQVDTLEQPDARLDAARLAIAASTISHLNHRLSAGAA